MVPDDQKSVGENNIESAPIDQENGVVDDDFEVEVGQQDVGDISDLNLGTSDLENENQEG